ncbi:MAG: T9SS type A sorting domain-containing protein, partial [Flavobacteriales bacterium]
VTRNYICGSSSTCDSWDPSVGGSNWTVTDDPCGACTNPSLNATDAATSILATSAQSGGNVTSAGSSSVTERGICWSTSSNPTTANNKTTTSGTTGAFSGLSMTGLTPGTKYYVRAYAIGCGTAYGAETWFWTGVAPVITTAYDPIKIHCESATFGFLSGAIGNDKRSCCGTDALGASLSQVTEFGFIYGVSNADVTNSTPSSLVGASIKDVSIKNTAATLATGIYNYQEVTGLTPSTTYYVKGYSTNSQGTTYGAVKTFATTAACAVYYSCSAANTWDTDNTCATPVDVPTSTSICYMRHDWGPVGGLTDANVQCGTATFMTARPYRLVIQSGGRVYMTGGNFTPGMQLSLPTSNAQFGHDGAVAFVNSSTTAASNEISRLTNLGSIVVKGSYINSLLIPSGGEYCYNGSWTNQTTGPGSINSDYSVNPSFPISKYTNASCYGAFTLPVQLLYFDVTKENNAVYISWSTGSEINNDYFEVQQSNDGITWKTISKVEGAGNSANILHYNIIDSDISGYEVKYYRLKQVDFDGTQAYSKLREVYFDENRNNELNAFDNGEHIVLDVQHHGTFEAQIFDTNGALVYQQSWNNSAGDSVLLIEKQNLAKGLYLVKAFNAKTSLSKKLLLR